MMTSQALRGADRFVTADTRRVHYLDWGGAGLPPLVVLHGLSGNAHAFDALAPLLATAYHVLAVDERGHGDTDWAKDGDYRTEAFAADLEGFRAVLGMERFSLLGTSLGGRIAMAYAGIHPHRVVRLVINDIGAEMDPRGAERIAISVAQAQLHFGDMPEVLAWLRKNRPPLAALGDEELTMLANWQVKPAPQGGYVWKMDPYYRQDLQRPTPAQGWGWAKAITAPTLLLRGGTSDLLMAETAKRMAAELKDCHLREVPGVGHAPTLFEPVALRALKEFLALP